MFEIGKKCICINNRGWWYKELGQTVIHYDGPKYNEIVTVSDFCYKNDILFLDFEEYDPDMHYAHYEFRPFDHGQLIETYEQIKEEIEELEQLV